MIYFVTSTSLQLLYTDESLFQKFFKLLHRSQSIQSSMRSMEIIVDQPISELKVEFLMRSKGILVPKMIIDHSPKSLDLSIGLWSSYLGILVNNVVLNQECFETMETIGFTHLILIMSCEL